MASLPQSVPRPRPFFQRWLDRRIPRASRVRLDQRRIFILPTRVGVAFLAALLTMLLAAINYQNSLAYALTFLLGSLFMVAILHTWRNLAGLELRTAASAPVFVGEQARLRVRLEGQGRAHQAISLGWPDGVRPQQVNVPADDQCEVELGLSAGQRGWLRPGRLRVESRFPLGLLVSWSWVDLDLAALVYPEPQAGDLPLVAGEEQSEHEGGGRALQAGADDYQGLRSWQPGESLRRLDWKAYSRGQGLLVKDFAALSGQAPSLDFAALEGDVETRLSRLCHWVVELSARQQPFVLTLPGERLGPDSGDAHRERCLRALALHGLNRERRA